MHRLEHHAARERDFFTLIELLVTMAVIAILAGLLFPALAKAKETARAICCVNQQKQIATGLAQYITDNNDYTCPDKVPTTDEYWYFMIWEYVMGTTCPKLLIYGHIDAPIPPSSLLYVCPSSEVMKKQPWTGNIYAYYPYTELNYGLLRYTDSATRAFKIMQIKSPSTKMQACETTPKLYPFFLHYMVWNLPCPNFRHSGGLPESAYQSVGEAIVKSKLPGVCNMIFFDGHVEGVRYQQYIDNYKTMLNPTK